MCDICGTVFLLFLMSTPGRFSGVSEVLYIIMNEEGELGLWLRMFGITKRNEWNWLSLEDEGKEIE